MDAIDGQLKLLLAGGGIMEDKQVFCDFSLADQHDVLASKGVTPTGPMEFVPVAKQTVTYIVAAVVINDDNELLMMQEAKPSCSGHWYLPAGRMEPGENIVEAVKREVVEETGLEFDPTTLLMIEAAAGVWFRFVFTGKIVGGKLKTLEDADQESLQAKWIRDFGELTLRAKDIIPLIEKGFEYQTRRDEPWHGKLLPTSVPYKKLYMRCIVIARKKTNNRMSVLVSEKNSAHLPLCELHPQRSVHSTLKKYMNEIFGSDLPQHRPHGVLSLEYNGKPAGQHDGMCLNVLVSVRAPVEEVFSIDKYTWKEVNGHLGEDLMQRVGKNMTVSLRII